MGISYSKVDEQKMRQDGSKQKTEVGRSNTKLKNELKIQLKVSPDIKVLLHGDHETQVSEGEEADFNGYLANCVKNPGHTHFIPIKSFSIENLPKVYQDQDLYQLIKATADLTVRVAVKMTSPHRPEFYPGTNVPYPFYNMINKTAWRLGSGHINVYKFTNGSIFDAGGNKVKCLNGDKYFSKFTKSSETCTCTKCQQSDKPSIVWWEIHVYTATHVVFDDTEASHTTCRLFYDGQDSQMVILDNFSIRYANTEEDWCELASLTCDPLGNKLYNMAVHRLELWGKVWKTYYKKSNVKLNFIVSHPHGCHKQVSFDFWVKNEVVSKFNAKCNRTQLTYTTCTCPGSSGATVNCVGLNNTHVHGGSLGSGYNYSAVGFYSK